MTLGILSRSFAVIILACATSSAVAQSATEARLLSLQNPSPAGAPVALVAEIDGLGGGAPTGKVGFWDGTTRLGQKVLGSPAGAGQATLGSGWSHSCALTAAGGVKCWGDNRYGQLGDGTTTQRLTPVNVRGLTSGVVAIAAGRDHSCALTAAGGVKCWGHNLFGQLGDGTTTTRLTPVDVSGLTRGVVAIPAGTWHNCALTAVGGVKCWGWNAYGQLGDGTTNTRFTPGDVRGLTSGVVAIDSSGDGHSCALTVAGGMKCWGRNDYGMIGDGTTTQRLTPVNVRGLTSGVIAIDVGYAHSCALTAAGGVKCWGWNDFGKLGDGTVTHRFAPVDVVGLTRGVVAIIAGNGHSCALSAVGGVKCWGFNGYGALGDGTTTHRFTPIDVSGLSSGAIALAAGDSHSCALTATGDAKCWGNNDFGQLGDGTLMNRTMPVATRNITSLVRVRTEFTTPPLPFGRHRLRVRYLGDATHARSLGGVGQLVQ